MREMVAHKQTNLEPERFARRTAARSDSEERKPGRA